MAEIRKYIVGGYVRDQILGVKCKDIDYAVEAPSYEAMRDWIVAQNGHIFLEKPEFLTIRARVGRDANDYVLCRKDGEYFDGRHPDKVFAGTIDDDLARRDFTMNAIAICEDGTYYDPFGGIADIAARQIRCVGSTWDRMSEDWLRMLRAARFSITKGMHIDDEIMEMFDEQDVVEGIMSISQERIREEIHKMFVCNTLKSMDFFWRHQMLAQAIFSDGSMWLKPTSEQARGMTRS